MRVVVAVGGHAFQGAEEGDGDAAREGVGRVVTALVGLARRHDLVVTHGNGPQVGWLARQARLAGEESPGLDVLGAESEGWLGYLLEQELANALPDREIATLITRVEVSADDPAWGRPSKPIGPPLDEAAAARLRGAGGHVVVTARGTRQAVASPHPRRILEMRTIQLLVRLGVLVICAGGGGIPVVRDARGRLQGAAAVIDKDLASALVAVELGAQQLLLLTDVPAVYDDWPERTRRIVEAPPHALAGRRFEPGSMAPKVEAARHFVQGTGGVAAIGAVADAEALLRGEAGTRIHGEATALRVARI